MLMKNDQNPPHMTLHLHPQDLQITIAALRHNSVVLSASPKPDAVPTLSPKPYVNPKPQTLNSKPLTL